MLRGKGFNSNLADSSGFKLIKEAMESKDLTLMEKNNIMRHMTDFEITSLAYDHMVNKLAKLLGVIYDKEKREWKDE